MSLRLLVIGPNDLLRHPIPNRLYHIAKYLSSKFDILFFSFPSHPHSVMKPRSAQVKEITYISIPVKDVGLYYIVNTPIFYSALKRIMSQVDLVLHGNIIPSYIVTNHLMIRNIFDYMDHYPQSASAYYKNVKTLAEGVVSMLVSRIIKRANAVVVPSYTFAGIIRPYLRYGVGIHVIPNGVDPHIFFPRDSKWARKELGIDFDGFLLLIQGSLDDWLDVNSIIDALKSNEDWAVLLVGYSHGKYAYQRLMSKISSLGLTKRVIRLPTQPYEKMPLVISAANITLAPYKKIEKNYTTPLKIIESLACSRPVVTTSIPEFRIWFKKGVHYYDSSNLTMVLKFVYENWESLVKDLIEYSIYIRKTFSWETLAEKYREIIETVSKI